MDAARTVRLLTVLFAGLALAFAGGALALARDRRAGVVRLGTGVAVARRPARGRARRGALARDRRVGDPDARAAGRAIWDAFLGDLRTAALILAGSGAVVAAAAASLIRPVDIGEPLRRAARAIAAEPARPALRVLRALGLVARGREPARRPRGRDARWSHARSARTSSTRARAACCGSSTARAEAARRASGRGRGPHRAVAALAVAADRRGRRDFAGTGAPIDAGAAGRACNGHAELCGRPLDEVALAATHNSMSAPLPGWFSAAHDRPIAAQLAGGIRGLLIDTHYADRLPNGRLRTELGGESARRRAGRRQPGGGRRGAADPRAARLRRRGRAGPLPLPLVLRDRRHAAGAGARRHPRVPRGQPGRGAGRRQPGRHLARGLRRRRPRRRARAVRLPRAGGRPLADAAARWSTAASACCSWPRTGRRGAVVPPRLRGDPPGDAVRVLQAGRAHRPGAAQRHVPAQSRPGLGAAVPRQPLDHDGPGPSPVQRRHA